MKNRYTIYEQRKDEEAKALEAFEDEVTRELDQMIKYFSERAKAYNGVYDFTDELKEIVEEMMR